MKGIVVDASVAAVWLLDDEVSETSEWVLNEMQAGVPIFVPTLWLLEVSHVLFNAERRKRIDRKVRDDALDSVVQLSLTICAAPTQIDLRLLWLYAEKHQLTPYNAEYLRVAKEQKLMLATLDGNLLAAARREKVLVAAPI